jgi:hypothetical protein
MATDLFKRLLFRRRRQYLLLFKDRDTKGSPAYDVLADLAKFCRANRTTAQVSPINQQVDMFATGLAEGRREVWLRVQKQLNMTAAEIYALSVSVEQPVEDDENG